jgi:Protein of unknown function (DUF3108)
MLQRFFPLFIALLVVLAAHGLALWSIGQQMHDVQGTLPNPLKPVAKAVFVRQVTRPLVTTAPLAAAIGVPEESVHTSKQSVLSTDKAQEAIKKEAPKFAKNMPPETAAALPAPTLEVNGTDTVGPFTDTLAMQGGWPVDTRLTYDLSGFYRGELTGTATLQWTRDMTPFGENYELRLDLAGTTLTAMLTSQGRLRDAALLPTGYVEHWPDQQRNIAFDGAEVVLANGKRVPRPLPVGGSALGVADVQDTLSQLIALGPRFASGQARGVPGNTVRVWLALPSAVREWEYELGPTEAVALPLLGAVETYHLKTVSVGTQSVTQPGAISAEIWLAPSLKYLPVRIKLTQETKLQLDMTANKIEQR